MKKWDIYYAHQYEVEEYLDEGWEPIGGFYNPDADQGDGDYVTVLRKEREEK